MRVFVVAIVLLLGAGLLVLLWWPRDVPAPARSPRSIGASTLSHGGPGAPASSAQGTRVPALLPEGVPDAPAAGSAEPSVEKATAPQHGAEDPSRVGRSRGQ